MSVETSQLGKETEYPTQYAPEVLFPIARQQARQAYAAIAGIQQGTDWWHVFEISWLDLQGKPQVAIGRLHIPASSPNLIESKSLKLYFNSFNFEKLSRQQFIETVERDLTQAAGASVQLELRSVDDLAITVPEGICLDEFEPSTIEYHPNAQLLKYDSGHDDVIEQSYYSHLLRSNCPVTNQPDWGTVFIRYRGKKPCEKALLAYIISYRQHNGFHEQCVEHIFADIWTLLKPQQLMVYAAYTRRGGLDINPCRVSDLSWMPTPIRLARQ
ncbi:NADPH-dependent 7-cyano-7-deazaguanine reductase QueF [Acinetobacter populi]|uniref:NADPH-dependent 7-cyano-7-deazaguanine reductase n=1 Tax=Acinetobacter populi TaxID=1582270 RepID=A0A1Z9Z175_9GAMM|nr:NADPH-dependent 7-cyano-7-deazaguanine reductase QueF [Acinetobacter populi]OUY08238.1 NADPH-dependent 7-cyano-7-deazaguanine reductase QueF [Acinetobacter populi]